LHPRRKINYQYSPTDSSAGDAAPAAAEAVGLPGASEAHLGDVLGTGCGWCSILGTSRSRSIPYNSKGSQRDVLAHAKTVGRGAHHRHNAVAHEAPSLGFALLGGVQRVVGALPLAAAQVLEEGGPVNAQMISPHLPVQQLFGV
jgi:hypothetical protein